MVSYERLLSIYFYLLLFKYLKEIRFFLQSEKYIFTLFDMLNPLETLLWQYLYLLVYDPLTTSSNRELLDSSFIVITIAISYVQSHSQDSYQL